MCSWQMMISPKRVGDSDALVVNVIDIFDFNGSVIPGCHALSQVMMCSWLEIKKASCLSLLRTTGNIILADGPAEEGLRLVVGFQLNKNAIREVIDKIWQPA